MNQIEKLIFALLEVITFSLAPSQIDCVWIGGRGIWWIGENNAGNYDQYYRQPLFQVPGVIYNLRFGARTVFENTYPEVETASQNGATLDDMSQSAGAVVGGSRQDLLRTNAAVDGAEQVRQRNGVVSSIDGLKKDPQTKAASAVASAKQGLKTAAAPAVVSADQGLKTAAAPAVVSADQGLRIAAAPAVVSAEQGLKTAATPVVADVEKGLKTAAVVSAEQGLKTATAPAMLLGHGLIVEKHIGVGFEPYRSSFGTRLNAGSRKSGNQAHSKSGNQGTGENEEIITEGSAELGRPTQP